MPPRKTASTPVVFLAISSSEVGRYRPLKELELEHKQLQALYEAAERAGRCELVTRFAVTLDDILAVFQSQEYAGRIAVFHFAGHAEEDLLVMQNATGDPLLAGAEGLAGFLAVQPKLQIFFINGCRSEAQMAALHAGGVPVVIATREEIPDESAREFAAHFHRGLSTGATIVDAFAAAQGAMQSAAHEHAWRWDPELWLLYAGSERDKAWKLGDRPPGDVPWRVPFLRNDAFVGREEDLRSLHAALTESGTVGIRPAGLTGMGGIGKTQLAVEYCYRYRDSYPDGVFWLNAAAEWRGEFAGLGTYLEPELAGEPEVRRIRAAADYLKAHQDCLLVLDNVAEPAAVGRPVTHELIPISLPCRVLLTTRSHDLGGVRPVEVTVLPEVPGLQLLLRSDARQPALNPGHAEHADARAIHRMLGGLPLALEIASAFLEEWPEVSLAGFRQRLHREGRLATLDAEGEELPAGSLRGVHVAAVAATLGEQWDALSTGRQVDEDARLLLRIAGQLPEAAQIPAARLGLLSSIACAPAAGGPSPLDRALRRLVRASLLEELRAGEVRLHPLVREFAAGKTDAESTPTLRRACGVNLLQAYQDVTELERQCAQRGVNALEADLHIALSLLAGDGDSQTLAAMLQQLLYMVQHESHTLHDWNRAQLPALFLQQWHKRALVNCDLPQARSVVAVLARRLVPYLAMQWTTGREALALVRTLSGHPDGVNAVTLTADGQLAVSASADTTLIVWDLASGAKLHTLRGHKYWVNAVAVTADGQRAVSASVDHTLKVWDLASGAELYTLSGHKRTVDAVAVTADGQRAVSASDDHTLKVWDLESGAELHTLNGHTDMVNAVTLTADGQRAVSASSDHTLKVWDLESGAELHTLSGHTDGVRTVAVTADGQRAVSASGDTTLKVWDLESGAELRTLSGHMGWVNAVALTADGQRAVSASDDCTLKVWDLASGAKLHTLRGHRGCVSAVAVAADGQRAVSASDDTTLKVWDLESGAELRTLSEHTNVINAVAVAANGQLAVSASDDRTLRVWNLTRGAELHTVSGHTDMVRAVAVTADGRLAVSASGDTTLKVWDLSTGAELHTLSGHLEWVNAVTLTADGRRAVSASDDRTLKVWDLASGAKLRTLRGHTGWVSAVAVTADGQRAVSASGDTTLKVWDLESRAELHTLSGHERVVNAVAVTADGQRAVSASGDRTLRVWDLESGAELHTLSGHTDVVRAVAVTADGQRAVSASDDYTLRVWDLTSGAELHTLSGHTDMVHAVVLTADGRLAVSASADCTLKVWDLSTGAELHTLSGHTGWVRAVALTADGRRAVSASDDCTLKVWDLTTSSPLASIALDAANVCISLADVRMIFAAGDAIGNIHCLRYYDPRDERAKAALQPKS